jgi:hypothetical protein
MLRHAAVEFHHHPCNKSLRQRTALIHRRLKEFLAANKRREGEKRRQDLRSQRVTLVCCASVPNQRFARIAAVILEIVAKDKLRIGLRISWRLK